MYGCYVKFTAKPGQREDLVKLMLEASGFMPGATGCQLYLINTSAAEPDVMWVTEIWDSQADADAVLAVDSVRAHIQRVLPLLASAPERIIVEPVGGKGMPGA